MKSKTTALILSVLVGGLGVDRFYLGYTGIGVLKLLTGGVFGIMYIIDIINIACGNLRPADGSPYEEDTQSTRSASASSLDELEKASRLHNEGVLSDMEYAKMKDDILNKR